MSTEPIQTLDTSGASGPLWTALALAQADVQSVGKDGTNTQRGYRYATTEAMIRGSRQHLAQHGLAFLSSWTCEDPPAIAGDIGKQHVAARVVIHWALGHEGGIVRGTATMDAIGSPARPPDKAVAAAVTYGLGFVLRGLLLLDRAEEDEHSPDRREEPKADPLWDAYAAARDRLMAAKRIGGPEAYDAICAHAGVSPKGEETDDELRRMTAAAIALLAESSEPKVPANRERAAASGEQVVTAEAQALDQWRAAARAYCEAKEADYLDAECKSPSAATKKAIRDAALALSAKAAGIAKWPKSPTVAHLLAATAALKSVTKPSGPSPRERWREAQRLYTDARELDHRKNEGEDPDADAFAAYTKETLAISAKAVGLEKWPPKPSDQQWMCAEQALLAEVARLGGAG